MNDVRRMRDMEQLTDRLIIRNLHDSDYPEFELTLNEYQKACFHGGRGFLCWLISQYTDMDIINGLISFGMFNKTDGKLIGTIGAGKHDALQEPEIFYFLLPEYRGQGYATEAVKEVTRWALENYNIPYLIGTVEIDNIKSQQVLERCGYQLLDTRSLLVHVENKQYDFLYYRCYSEQSSNKC